MKKIDELKAALEVEIDALAAADREVANWSYQDLHRQDGSGAQDARHERIGRETREHASHVRQKVESLKNQIAELTKGI